ncbi:MAG: hypothetical protein AB1489_04555 [Acidobacteriota bacterium]
MCPDEKFQPFKVGDWQARQQPRATPKVETAEVKIERDYPLFRFFLTKEDFSPLFQKCEETCIELDRIIRTGSREAAQEAQYALNAYGRAMQLASELIEIKAKFRSR